MKKGYFKRENIIVTMACGVCCFKENCSHIDDISVCRNVNAKCEYEKQRYDALLHYEFANDKPVTMGLRYEDKQIFASKYKI